jgi:hypothetical protein
MRAGIFSSPLDAQHLEQSINTCEVKEGREGRKEEEKKKCFYVYYTA